MSMNNITTIDQTQLLQTLQDMYDLNIPLFIWGGPGCGKTEIGGTFADLLNAYLAALHLGQYDQVDLRGLPDVEQGSTVWCVPRTIPFKGAPGWPDDLPIFLFLDEAMQAAPAVQAVAFQLIRERRIGEHELRDNVYIFAASNRETDRAGTNKMLSPLANRFAHVQLMPTLDGWKDWAYKSGIHEIVLAYLNSRPDFLDQFEEAQKANTKAFATPRSWDQVSRAFHKFGNDPARLERLVSALIGTAVSAELLQFSRMARSLPTMEQIKADPEGTVVPEQNDERYCVSTMLANRCTPEHSTAVIRYIKRYPQQYQVLFMADYTRRDASAVVNDAPMLEYQTSLHSAIYG